MTSVHGRYQFGFWPRLDGLEGFRDSSFIISPADRASEAAQGVLNDPQINGNWFEPPLEERSKGLLVPTPRFELPSTHVLETPGRAQDDQLGEFLVLVLGFTLGMRFTSEGTGHLARAAIRERTLVNFLATRREVLHVLGRALAFWDGHGAEVRRLAFGTIHWHLSAQSHEAQHEQFAWAYTVMDGLHRLACLSSPSYAATATRTTKKGKTMEIGHSARPVAMAKEFGIPLPPSFAGAGPAPSPVAALVTARNELIHEARWDRAPIGYAVSQDGYDLVLALQHFCSQVILRLLGVECEFCRHTYSGQLQGLDVIGMAQTPPP